MRKNSDNITEQDIAAYIHDLEQQNEFKSELISTSAHQVRTTLTANKWALKEIVNGNNGPVTEAQTKLLEKLVESNEQMIRIVTELIDVNHTEDTHPKYTFGPVDLHKLIARVIEDFHGEANEKDVAVSFDETTDAQYIIGDEQKLKTVFQALVENAIKYSNPGGSVMVHIEEHEDDVLVSVKDEGIGIPEEEQTHIFQKFYRAKNAEEMHSVGSGLGLFSAAHVVGAHGGNMWFDSKENLGTTFFISIPLPRGEVVVK